MTATPAELEHLYRDHYVGFRRALASLVGSQETATDALQEGFARALAAREQFRGDCPLSVWVWRISYNVALEYSRARAAVEQRQVEMDGHEPAAPISPEPGHNDSLVTALHSLPERRRLVVFLRYFAGCSYAEIAQICEISEGTVAATIAQARAALRKKLTEELALPAGAEEE